MNITFSKTAAALRSSLVSFEIDRRRIVFPTSGRSLMLTSIINCSGIFTYRDGRSCLLLELCLCRSLFLFTFLFTIAKLKQI